MMPAKDLPPTPLQAGHAIVLWPWHLGHSVLVGIARPPSSNNTEGNLSEITLMAGQHKPLHHQATKVAVDDQAAKSRVAGVASGGQLTLKPTA